MTRLLVALLIAAPQALAAQTISQRGFVDGAGVYFPQDALNDPVNVTGDLLVREEVFIKPAPWIQFAAGGDIRANTHDQVDASWRVDFSDRGRLRPALAIRRLSTTISRGWFTLDAGKQFLRWGKTDIVTPTDWFAPRDFLNVIDNEFLPVTGLRAGARFGVDTIEGVWDRFTPSRTPLVDQRWVVPPPGPPVTITRAGRRRSRIGRRSGVRWSHAGSRLEYALAFFDGFNHLPNIELLPTLGPARSRSGRATRHCEASAATRRFRRRGSRSRWNPRTSPRRRHGPTSTCCMSSSSSVRPASGRSWAVTPASTSPRTARC